MENKPKRGPLSQSEKVRIVELRSHLTVSEIAEKLNRPESTVRNYIEKELGQRVAEGVALPEDSRDIENRPYWNELQAQFSPSELRLFAFHWKEIRNQFNEDIFYTEELQIIELCRLEILTNRMLREQQSLIGEAQLLEQSAADLDPTSDDAHRIRERLSALRAAQNSFSNEYRALYEKKTKALDQLKATRRDRIKRIEDQKQTLTGWVSAIMTDGALREKLAEYAEKHYQATTHQREKLSNFHLYSDGINDRPLLTPETVTDDDSERMR